MSTRYASGRYASVKLEKESERTCPSLSPFHFQFIRLKLINVRSTSRLALLLPHHVPVTIGTASESAALMAAPVSPCAPSSGTPVFSPLFSFNRLYIPIHFHSAVMGFFKM